MWELTPSIPRLDKTQCFGEKQVGALDVKRRVGAGKFGVLFECTLAKNNVACWKDDDRAPGEAPGRTDGRASYAVKVIQKRALLDRRRVKAAWRAVRHVESEARALLALRHHPNIIELFDIRHGPEVIFFVMELAETDLYKHIVKHKPDGLDPSEAKRIMVEIGGAVSHMHRLSICHLDLKPENVLLVSARRTVKLCDFGNAAVGYDGGPTVTKLTDFVGSCGFFAPELATNNSYYDGRLADSWSCGVVFYEMLGGFGNFRRRWVGPYTTFFQLKDADQLMRGVAESVEIAKVVLRKMIKALHHDPLFVAWGGSDEIGLPALDVEPAKQLERRAPTEQLEDKALAFGQTAAVLFKLLLVDATRRSTLAELERTGWCADAPAFAAYCVAVEGPSAAPEEQARRHYSLAASLSRFPDSRVQRGAAAETSVPVRRWASAITAPANRDGCGKEANKRVAPPLNVPACADGDKQALLASIVEWTATMNANMAVAVTRASDAMEIVYANTTWESVFGCAIEEAVGHRYGVVCKGVDSASSDALAEALRRTGKASAELVYYRFGDASRPFAARVVAKAVFTKSPTAPDAAGGGYYFFAVAKLQASPCSIIRAAESPAPSLSPPRWRHLVRITPITPTKLGSAASQTTLQSQTQSPAGPKPAPGRRSALGAARAFFARSTSFSGRLPKTPRPVHPAGKSRLSPSARHVSPSRIPLLPDVT